MMVYLKGKQNNEIKLTKQIKHNKNLPYSNNYVYVYAKFLGVGQIGGLGAFRFGNLHRYAGWQNRKEI